MVWGAWGGVEGGGGRGVGGWERGRGGGEWWWGVGGGTGVWVGVGVLGGGGWGEEVRGGRGDARTVVRPAVVFFPAITARHSSVWITLVTVETFGTMIVVIAVAHAKSKRVSFLRRASRVDENRPFTVRTARRPGS